MNRVLGLTNTMLFKGYIKYKGHNRRQQTGREAVDPWACLRRAGGLYLLRSHWHRQQ